MAARNDQERAPSPDEQTQAADLIGDALTALHETRPPARAIEPEQRQQATADLAAALADAPPEDNHDEALLAVHALRTAGLAVTPEVEAALVAALRGQTQRDGAGRPLAPAQAAELGAPLEIVEGGPGYAKYARTLQQFQHEPRERYNNPVRRQFTINGVPVVAEQGWCEVPATVAAHLREFEAREQYAEQFSRQIRADGDSGGRLIQNQDVAFDLRFRLPGPPDLRDLTRLTHTGRVRIG
jgi:hypothetical protein